MPSNEAAYLIATGQPLEVKSAPYTSPKENEIVIKNGAVAINPVDWGTQTLGNNLFPWLFHPYILGTDLAGTVAEVGSAVSRFKVGDRVLAFSSTSTNKNPAEGAFQEYTVSLEKTASAIPGSLSFEEAAVLPMGICVAATGLFQKDYLGLEYPALSPKPTGKAVLIWGGATSMGSNAIQMAVAAGYEVVTTASAKNFEYVRKLGASQVFDYGSKTVVDDLIEAFAGKTLVGVFDGIGINGAFEACVTVLQKTSGSKFIAACMPPPQDVPEGITAKFIDGAELRNNEVGKMIFGEFIPEALAAGKYVAAPEPQIAGKGLESTQAAIDLWRNGVSASKIVVSL